MKPKQLTKAEEEVMQILWDLGTAPVAAIIEELPEPKPAYNTVSTIVRILESKGFVDHEQEGKGYRYFPLITRETYSHQTLSKLAENYFQGSVKSMLSFFVKNRDISLQDVEDILSEIDTQKRKL